MGAREVVDAEGSSPAKKKRVFTDEERMRIVAETLLPGASVSVVSRRYDINANLIFKWRRRLEWHARTTEPALLPVTIVDSKAVAGIPSPTSPAKSRAKATPSFAHPLSHSIVVELVSGHRVQISPGSETELVACVLRCLA